MEISNTENIITTPAAARETAVEAAAEHVRGVPAESGLTESAALPVTQTERLSEILQQYGFKANEKNMAMLQLMLENAIPLTRENVARMNQALKLTDAPEKALFLLMNNIRLTQANAAQLDGLADGRIRITEQISNLLQSISEMPDTPLRDSLLRLFSAIENADTANVTPAPAQGSAEVPAQGPQPQAAQPPTQASETAPQLQPTQQAPQAPGIAPPPPETERQSAQIPQQQLQGTQAAAPQSQSPATAPQSQPPATAPPQAEAARQAAQTQAHSPETAPQSQQTTQAQPPQTIQPQQATAAQQTTVQQPGVSPPLAEQIEGQTVVAAQKKAQSALPRVSFKLLGSAPKDIDRFLNSLRDNLEQARQLLNSGRQREMPGSERVLRQIQALSEHIDFVAHIKNQLFVQLPVFHNGLETQTALHIYKDAKQKKDENDKTNSAIIALETATMGHFETYVQKRARGVTCQFRLKDKEIERLVRANIHKLESLLREYQYSLEAFSFMPPGEPYSLLGSPASGENAASASAAEAAFIFDKKA